MSFLNAAFVYFLIWWLMLFTVLPLGIKRHTEDGKGYDAGAPEKPDLKKKLIINTLLTFIVLGIIQLLVKTGVINWQSFREAWK